jgi:hypothetical protein
MKNENKNQKETTEGIAKTLRKYNKEALALKEEFLKNNPTDWSSSDPIECAKKRDRNMAIQRQARAIFYGYKAQERYDLLLEELRRKRRLECNCTLDAFKEAGAKENELEKVYIEQEKSFWRRKAEGLK